MKFNLTLCTKVHSRSLFTPCVFSFVLPLWLVNILPALLEILNYGKWLLKSCNICSSGTKLNTRGLRIYSVFQLLLIAGYQERSSLTPLFHSNKMGIMTRIIQSSQKAGQPRCLSCTYREIISSHFLEYECDAIVLRRLILFRNLLWWWWDYK